MLRAAIQVFFRLIGAMQNVAMLIWMSRLL